VCKMTDNTFSKLRITRAYIRLLCIPEGDARMVSLVQIGNYEIRMLEASKADTADGPLFLIELFDHDGQSSVDSRICDNIEDGVAAFEDFAAGRSRADPSSQLRLDLVEVLPDLAMPRTRLADEV